MMTDKEKTKLAGELRSIYQQISSAEYHLSKIRDSLNEGLLYLRNSDIRCSEVAYKYGVQEEILFGEREDLNERLKNYDPNCNKFSFDGHQE